MFDLLCPPGMSDKGRRVSQALLDGALKIGLDARLMSCYDPRAGAALVVYGPGGPDRFEHFRRHQGRRIAWDLGYWERHLPFEKRKFRVSIDALHPRQVMGDGDPGPARWASAGLEMTRSACRGPVLLVGNGPKSIAVGAAHWTADKARELRLLGIGPISYRPKPGRTIESGVDFDTIAHGPIEEVLADVSMVVCRHSNVAIDACRAGVPVVCDEGAAAAIYPRRLEDAARQPGPEVRAEFLRRLAWWQWSIDEMRSGEAWQWLVKRLGA